jgi:hypothetical protein
MSRMRLVVASFLSTIALGTTAVFALKPAPSTSSSRREGNGAGEEKSFARVREFLAYVRGGAPKVPKGTAQIDLRSGKALDPDTFIGYVASAGVEFAAVEDRTQIAAPRAEIAKQMRMRQGEAYKSLMLLAYTLRWAFVENPPFTSETVGPKTLVKLGDNFVLTFVNEDGKLQISRIEDVSAGGD